MRGTARILGVAALLVAAGFMLSAQWVQADVVKIGIADDAAKAPHYRSLLGHLNFGGTLSFEMAFFETTDELYRAFRTGELRLALLGPVLYVEARHEDGVVPLVKDVPASSVIFARADSPIRSLADLRGHRIALGYAESTTSNLIPRLLMQQNKIPLADLTDNETGFEPGGRKIVYFYAGSHAAVVEAVLSGRADAGAVVDAIYTRHAGEGLRVVERSEPYPGVPLVCHKDEDPQFMNEVRRLFTTYKAPADVPYHQFKEGATVASDSDYDTIRFLCNIVLNTNY